MSARAALALLLLLCACQYQSARDDTAPDPIAVPTSSIKRAYAADGKTLIHRWGELRWPDGRIAKEGPELEWYASGARKSEREWRRGAPAGTWTTWYESGQQRSLMSFAEELAPMRFWHPNGRLSAEGPARAGVRDGEWTYWHASGVLSKRGAYVAGRMHGEWTLYDERGRVAKRGRFEDGVRVGVWQLAPDASDDDAPLELQ